MTKFVMFVMMSFALTACPLEESTPEGTGGGDGTGGSMNEGGGGEAPVGEACGETVCALGEQCCDLGFSACAETCGPDIKGVACGEDTCFLGEFCCETTMSCLVHGELCPIPGPPPGPPCGGDIACAPTQGCCPDGTCSVDCR